MANLEYSCQHPAVRFAGPTPDRNGLAGASRRRWRSLALATLTSVALAGCFGGGDDPASTPAADPLAAVPDSATQSPAGTVDYQRALAAMTDDSREAIDVSALVLPTSDTDEPLVVE